MPKEQLRIMFNAAVSACEKSGVWEHALLLMDTRPSCVRTPELVVEATALFSQ